MEPVSEVILTPTTNIIMRLLFVVLFIAAITIFTKRVVFLFNALKIGVPDLKPRTDDSGKRISSVTERDAPRKTDKTHGKNKLNKSVNW